MARPNTPLLPLLALVLACQPEVPDRSASRPAAPPKPVELALELAPPADPRGKIAPFVELAISGPLLDADTVLLVRGDVSDVALASLAEGTVPASTRARAVEARMTWSGDRLVVTPSGALAAGRHTLAVGSRRQRFVLEVSDTFGPVLRRLFPPAFEASGAPVMVLCGDDLLPESLAPVTFALEEAPSVERAEAIGAPRCALLRSTEGSPLRAPPAVEGAGALYLLDAGPVAPEATPREAGSTSCASPEVPLGPVCAAAFDDHVTLRPPHGPLLADVRLGDVHETLSFSGMPRDIAGLTPDTTYTLAATFMTEAGEVTHASVAVHTTPPAPRLVVTEVLADCLGVEPQCEWVEVSNLGTAPVDLTGHVLLDDGGATALPPAALAPGEIAVIVNDSYAPGGGDVPIAASALVLHVPKLGKNGLSNGGEPITLVDPAGAVLSQVPALASKAGRSIARGADGHYALATPTPGLAN